MAKPLRGECEMELAGEKYILRLGIGEIEELENITGLGTLALAQSFATTNAKVSHAHAVLLQALQAGGKKVSAQRVRQIVEAAGYQAAIGAALQVLTVVLTDPNEGNASAAGAVTGTAPAA